MTVQVPCENAGMAGLRRVIGPDDVKKVTAVLTDDVSEMPKNWNRRFKHNREKIKTGDVFELAEVVRNLAIREIEKGLSTGEKQMYTRAKKILASEFMYALDTDEDGAEEYLDGLLTERFGEHRRSAVPPPERTPCNGRDRGRRLRAAARSRRPEGLRGARGRPLIEWSLAALDAARTVGPIVVAAPAATSVRRSARRASRPRRRRRRHARRIDQRSLDRGGARTRAAAIWSRSTMRPAR